MRRRIEAYSSVRAEARRSTFSRSTSLARNLSVTSMMSMFQGSISPPLAISSNISMDSSWRCAGVSACTELHPRDARDVVLLHGDADGTVGRLDHGLAEGYDDELGVGGQ